MEANPTFDRESEKDQEYWDRVDTLYSESLKPLNITPEVVADAFRWGLENNKLEEIAETVVGDDAYLGSLVGGLVRDFLYEEAMTEASHE